MTGFSAEWLALREPADHAARNREVLAATTRYFADRPGIKVLDLGSGSGSNLRALAQHLPAGQSWTLVDYDPALLAVAGRAVPLWLEENGVSFGVSFRQADLAKGVPDDLLAGSDLVTAAAFFDLVSPGWIEDFVARLAARNLPLYTALIYNGEESWDPPHRLDEAVNSAFERHQRTDKGFGPAAGPAAPDILSKALRQKGYEVVTGDSPWRLGAAGQALIRPLAAGIAAAAGEAGKFADLDLRGWLEARQAPVSCRIGHTDLLAIPPR